MKKEGERMFNAQRSMLNFKGGKSSGFGALLRRCGLAAIIHGISRDVHATRVSIRSL
jgi:hypothetical protein